MSPTSVRLACFHHLRRLRHIWQTLTVDWETAATLVHAFVTSHVDYCNVILAGALKVITNILRVMNAAARILNGMRKSDRSLTQLMHDNLHWLDVPERVKYSHYLDSSLPHRCRASVSSCQLRSGVQDGTEMSSTLRRWSPARRAVWTHGSFLYSVQDYGTLCLDCYVTLATTLIPLDIL